MRMNKDVSLAVNLISMLDDTPRTVLSLAKEMKESHLFLQQIVRKLRLRGIVSVVKGPGGGVRKPERHVHADLLSILQALGKAPSREILTNDNSERVNYNLHNYLHHMSIPYGRLVYV